MNWTKDRSIALSRACVAVFALLLAAVDVIVVFARGRIYINLLYSVDPLALVLGVLLGSLFAWPALLALWLLLGNLQRGQVFTEANVNLLRLVSWCFVGAALVTGVCGLVFPPAFALTAAAGFMALIVRIVKNVFQQAIAMKSELDLTV